MVSEVNYYCSRNSFSVTVHIKVEQVSSVTKILSGVIEGSGTGPAVAFIVFINALAKLHEAQSIKTTCFADDVNVSLSLQKVE